MYIKNAFNHFKTITSHRLLVMKYCFRAGMIWQGLTHDLSKYSWVEFSEGYRYYQGTRSPNAKAKEENGISYAWVHHKGRNRHHYEYWIDYDFNSELFLAGQDMPKKYIAEMVFDRISACRIYEGAAYTKESALRYYDKGKDKLWFVSDNTKHDLEMLLRMTAENSEEHTINYIKNIYLKKG